MQLIPRLTPDKMPASLVNDHAQDVGDSWGGPYGGPPNMGGDFLPHIFTVAGRYGVATRSYSKGDEAWLASRMDCEIMRNEPAIMECLEARMRSVSLLNWHIEPIDEDLDDRTRTILKGSRKGGSTVDREELSAKLTLIMKYTPNITKMFYSLMDALWYGRYATYNHFQKTPIDGMGWATTIKKWEPRHGDKLVFRYDDHTGQNDPDQVGIRVGPGYDTQSDFTDYAGNIRRQVEATQYGLAYWLTTNQRKHVAVHRHIIEDGDFDHPIKADSVHGVGIRSRIYWTWKSYSECFKLLMEYIERTALGIEIWRYPAHNERAKNATEEAAQRRGSPGRSILMVPVPEGEQADLYNVDIVEPGLQGADVLQNVLHSFFGHKMKRYILGQTLSSEAEATGMGSGVADAHLATLSDIVTWDARSLAETITTDILRPLQLWNFPESQGIMLKFKFDTESPEAQSRLEAYRAAWEMGAKIKSEDIYQIIGASRPSDDDEDVLDVNGGGGGGMPMMPGMMPGMMGGESPEGEEAEPELQEDARQAEIMRQGVGDCDPNMKGPDGESSCKVKQVKLEACNESEVERYGQKSLFGEGETSDREDQKSFFESECGAGSKKRVGFQKGNHCATGSKTKKPEDQQDEDPDDDGPDDDGGNLPEGPKPKGDGGAAKLGVGQTGQMSPFKKFEIESIEGDYYKGKLTVTNLSGEPVVFEGHREHVKNLLPEGQFALTPDQVKGVQEKIDKLNSRRKKHDFEGEPFELVKLEEGFYDEIRWDGKQTGGWVKDFELDRVKDKDDLTEKRRTRDLYELKGDMPQHNGWKFIAKLTPIVTDGDTMANLVTAPNNDEVPQEYRDQVGLCTHCGKKRKRNDTFVLKHENGETKCIGRSCMKDFLGHGGDPAKLAKEFNDINAFRDMLSGFGEGDYEDGEDDSYGGRGGDGHYQLADTFLPAVAAIIRNHGWVSGKAAREREVESTRSKADYYFRGANRKANEYEQKYHRDFREKNEPTDDDKQFAKDAVEWIKGQQDLSNDYLYNLSVTASADKVMDANMGIATSLLAAYARDKGINLKTRKKESEEKPGKNEHVGEIGKRQTFKDMEVADIKTFSYYDYHGRESEKAIIEFRDSEGRSVKWFQDIHNVLLEDYPIGSKHTFKATPNKHDEYRDQKQTVVNRLAKHVEPTKVDKKDIEVVYDEYGADLFYGDWTVAAYNHKGNTHFSLYKNATAVDHPITKIAGEFDEKKALAKAKQVLQKVGATPESTHPDSKAARKEAEDRRKEAEDRRKEEEERANKPKKW